MSNSVMIKSYPNGIALQLDETISFEELYGEVIEKFKVSKQFFKDTTIVLAFEGRTLSTYEQYQLLYGIEKCTDLTVACIAQKEDEIEKKFSNALLKHMYNPQNEFTGFYRGSLKRGQTLETQSTVIMIGDVEKGAKIVSKKNIIVIGNLYGKAYAGSNGCCHRFILALKMSPEAIRIGDFRYSTNRKNIDIMKKNIHPQIAMVQNDFIAIKSFTNESLCHQ